MPKSYKCEKCKSDVSLNDDFCHECGSKLLDEEQAVRDSQLGLQATPAASGWDLTRIGGGSVSFSQNDIEAFKKVTRPSRMKAVPAIPGRNSLSMAKTGVDYGECGQIFKDKYGEDLGEKTYQKIFVDSNNNYGWTLAKTIQKEKISLLNYFNITVSSMDLDEWPYWPLWIMWMKVTGAM